MHSADALRILTGRFGHPPARAEKIISDYVTCMDETLQVDFDCFARLLAQVAPGESLDARRVAAEWIAPGSLKD